MRILMLFTIGFAAACAIGAYFGCYLFIGILALICAVLLLFVRKKTCKIAAMILFGLSVGTIWIVVFNSVYLSGAKNYDGKTINTTAIVSDYSFETDYGIAADGKIELDGKKFSVRLYLSHSTALKPGDCISGDIRLRLTTRDSIRGQTSHQGDGIFLLGYVKEDALISPADKVPAKFFAAKLRYSIRQILIDAFPADTVAFANALFLGDNSLLDYETDTDFKLSGIRHIIAVSGLHVSILISVVFMLCGKNRYLSTAIGVPLLLLFAAVAGFTPSVMRACIMQMLVLIGMFLNKEYDPPTSLAFAVLVMLLINPITIVSVSFQLSVGCSIGIFLLYERINQYLMKLLRAPKGNGLRAKLSRWFSASVSVTISTFITTTPLSAMYFGSISVVGILTNLLTLWVVSFIFCGIIAVIIAGAIWMPLAKGIAWIISFPMRYVIFVADFMADLPISAVYTKSIYIVIWLIACYCIITAMAFWKKKYPLLMTGSIVGLLIFAIGLSWLEPRLDHYRITVFDVGQGQSILVQYEDHSYLVDCGGDSDKMVADTVSQHLLSMGITHLDGAIVTHYDSDHAGALPNLLTTISIDTLYLPDVEDESGLKEALSKSDNEVIWVSGLESLKVHGMDLTMLIGHHNKSDNESSMCILFQFDDYDILITGDRSAIGERELLSTMNLPKIDTLIVGHHGSNSATCIELLEAVKPDVAVISVGRDNHFGHPSEEVLFRLRLFGCSIWRTDRDGTIVFKG